MKVKIIYETQVGTTKYVAETIQKKLTELGHQVDLHAVRSRGMKPVIEGYDLVVFGSPTYNAGQLETSMTELVATFAPDLSSYKVAIFALGDQSYGHFCGAAEILEAWITARGGKLAVPTLKIDGYPKSATPIVEWAEQLTKI